MEDEREKIEEQRDDIGQIGRTLGLTRRTL